MDDTIRRLQAFERAGADVLFAPGLPDLGAVRTLCAAVSKPVNFMVGITGKSFSVAELAAAGVKPISLATSLYRAAMTGLLGAVRIPRPLDDDRRVNRADADLRSCAATLHENAKITENAERAEIFCP